MRVDTKKLELARLRAGLFRRELAEKSGLSRAAITRACTKGECGLHVAKRLAETLGLTVGSIIVEPTVRKPSVEKSVA